VLAYHILTNFSPLQFHKHEDKPGRPFAVIKTDTFSFNHVPQFTQVKLAGATEEELRVLDELNSHVEADQVQPTLDSPGEIKDRTKACKVNYVPTCSFGINCILPPAQGLPTALHSNTHADTHDSDLCVFHYRLAAYWDQQNPPTKYNRHEKLARETGYDASVSFQRPAPGSEEIIAVQLVHEIHLRFVVWTVDCEFANVKGAHSIVFIVTIRDVKTGDIVLSTSINYDRMELTELERQLTAYQETLSRRASHFCSVGYLAKWYNALVTNGISLLAIGEAMRTAGFSPSIHRIISWWTPVDCNFLSRALHGSNALIEKTSMSMLEVRDGQSAVMQPYNLARIIKLCTNLMSVACGWTYRSFFQKTLDFHHPDQDTLATSEIYRHFIRETERWVEGDKRRRGALCWKRDVLFRSKERITIRNSTNSSLKIAANASDVEGVADL
jgi:hypothetical protein